jgi:hypothetical protein
MKYEGELCDMIKYVNVSCAAMGTVEEILKIAYAKQALEKIA